MRFPKVHGTIKRRLLVNFRVDPAVMQRQLPAPFRPKLHDGSAIAGICLIRLEEIRPGRFPRAVGLSSENAAHRVAVVWEDATGAREGVYIPRRDTGSLVNHLAGGRLFPMPGAERQRATFRVVDDGRSNCTCDRRMVVLKSTSSDTRLRRALTARAAQWPPRRFFETGSIGYQ
jgi:uncharacterized protein YqjF (DUF2071 family)